MYCAQTGYQFDPSIQVQNDGLSLGVAWYGYQCDGSDASCDGVLYRERDYTGSWGSIEIAIQSTWGRMGNVSLDYDSSNNAHVIYSGGVMSFYSPIYHITRTWSTGTWGVATQVSNDGANTQGVSNLVCALDNSLHFCYTNGADGAPPWSLYYCVKPSSGSWSAPALLLSSKTHASVGIQLDAQRNVLVYTGYKNGSTGWSVASWQFSDGMPVRQRSNSCHYVPNLLQKLG